MELRSITFYKTFTVPSEKFRTTSFAFLIMKNILVFPALSKFAVKLISSIALA